MTSFNYPYGYANTGGYSYQPTVTQNYFAWVQGEAAAQAFQVAPNSTVVLMDSEQPILYMKSADSTGRPGQMVKQYLVTEEQFMKLQNGVTNQDFVSKEEFDKAIADIQERYVLRKEYRNG